MKWIKASEKLPNDGSEKLVYTPDDDHEEFQLGWFHKEQEEWLDVVFDCPIQVSHWMELPLPPVPQVSLVEHTDGIGE